MRLMIIKQSRMMQERSTYRENSSVPELQYVETSTSRRNVRLGEIGRWLLNNHLDTIRARREYDRKSQAHPIAAGADAIAVTALESVPFVGDGITALEGIRGKTLDGLPLSIPERIIYELLSIPPPFNPIDLPARPFISLYHLLDEHIFTPILLGVLGNEAKREDEAVKKGNSLAAAIYEESPSDFSQSILLPGRRTIKYF